MRAAVCVFLIAAVGIVVPVATADLVTAEFLGPGDGRIATAGPNNLFGQTFLANVGGPLSTVSLFLKRNGTGTSTLTVDIWNLGPNFLPTGAALGGASIVVQLTTEYQWYTFDFASTNIVLAEGQRYAWSLRSLSGDAGWDMRSKSGGTGYPDGRAIYRSGSPPVWNFTAQHPVYGERDFLFRATVIPEPAALGLLGLGAVALARRPRR